MKSDAILHLSGEHPYYPDLGPVAIELPVVASVPGTAVTDRNTTGVTERRAEEAWSPLAGPYETTWGVRRRISRDEILNDGRALLGLVWDLQGREIHPALGRREPLEFVAVIDEVGSVVIWRRTREMLCERDAKIDRIRSAGGEPKLMSRKEGADAA